jgi:hypothetical protein
VEGRKEKGRKRREGKGRKRKEETYQGSRASREPKQQK